MVIMAPIIKLAHLVNSPIDFFLAVCLGFFFGVALESGGLANCRKIAGVFYLRDATVVKVMFTAIITAMVLLFSASAIGVLDLSLLYVPATYIFSYIIAGCILGAGMVMGGY